MEMENQEGNWLTHVLLASGSWIGVYVCVCFLCTYFLVICVFAA